MGEPEWVIEFCESTAADGDWRPVPGVKPRSFTACEADLGTGRRLRGYTRIFRMRNVRTDQTVNWPVVD